MKFKILGSKPFARSNLFMFTCVILSAICINLFVYAPEFDVESWSESNEFSIVISDQEVLGCSLNNYRVTGHGSEFLFGCPVGDLVSNNADGALLFINGALSPSACFDGGGEYGGIHLFKCYVK